MWLSVVMPVLNHSNSLNSPAILLESWTTTTINTQHIIEGETCSSRILALEEVCVVGGMSRFIGESSMGRSPNFVRTRSLTESVMPMFLRSCDSAAWIRRSVDVVVILIIEASV